MKTKTQLYFKELDSHNVKRNLPVLFNKKSKNIVIKPLTYLRDDSGVIRHFTPAAQE